MPVPGWLRISGWVVTVAAAGLYAVMVIMTLPRLAEMAGQQVFDLLPGGYDLATAQAILTGLGEIGRAYYSIVQHTLDAFFPPLLTLTLVYWTWRAAGHWRAAGLALHPIVLAVLLGVAVLAGAFDLAENAAVAELLVLGPDAITEEYVGAASMFTVAKSVAALLAYVALLVLGAGPYVWRALSPRAK